MTKNKNTGKNKGAQCSGYKVFPDGSKCKGCPDCVGAKKVKHTFTTFSITKKK
ncbi:MAG: hypothetical protein PHE56_08225 [Bacteroidales bacterium]|nr:hypothetical protein [Bacteroidales bacterium]